MSKIIPDRQTLIWFLGGIAALLCIVPLAILATGGSGTSFWNNYPPPTVTPIATPTGVSVSAWDNVTIKTVCLTTETDVPRQDDGTVVNPIDESVSAILMAMGVTLVDDPGACDATLEVSLAGSAYCPLYAPDSWSEGYSGPCCTGGRVSASLILSAEGQDTLVAEFSADDPADGGIIGQCGTTSGDEYDLQRLWGPPFVEQLYMWWGVPALIAAWRCETGCASYVTEFLTDSVPTGVAVEAAITGLRYNELCTNRQARLVLFLMAPEGETAIPYLIDALYYGDGKTGITRTLGKYGPAALSAVPHLAFILHDESAGSDLKQHAHESLTAITGEDFGQDADAWVEWWKKQ